MYYDDKTTVFLDGQWMKASEAKSSLYDQTMHYGNGVFEGIRAYKSADGFNIFKAKEHFDRLRYSTEKMQMKLPYTSEQLTNIAYRLVDENNLQDAYIRPMVYQGANMSLTPGNEVHVFMACWKWSKYLGSEPLNVIVSSYQRPNPKSCHVEAKVSGHYVNSILATSEAKKLGYDEALLLDINGNVAEGPGANFFYEKDEVLYTPGLGHILPGITRATVIEIARTLGIYVVEKEVSLDDALNADSAFFTGTAAEVAQIASLNGVSYPKGWCESAGHNISLMFHQKVAFNQYQGLTII